MKHIKIVKAENSQKHLINNLLQLYLYDMTEYYRDWPIGEGVLYEYTMLEKFWQYPYLIYCKKNLVGFCLVIDHCPITNENPCWFIAELFILKVARNQGIASEVVNQTLKLHKGKWSIGVIVKNKKALSFWEKTLPVEAMLYEHDGEDWKIFKIES